MKTRFPLSTAIAIAALLLPQCLLAAENIDSSNITQVVKDVSVIKAGTKSRKAARINDTFSVPDIMKTGADSRAEMIAPDQTVTRVGANTIFSFEPEKREINLQKGSILFNSPTGKGGGTIKTAAATASVLGTTLIVVTTDNGGFKVLVQEGTGRVKTPKGRFRTMKAGQMVYALPGGDLSQVLTFQLSQQVGASFLVNGFKKPLPSLAKIEAAISKQEAQIAKGQLQETGLLAGNEADKAFKVDVNAREVLIQQQRTGGGITGAGLTDAIVAAPVLERARVFSTFNLDSLAVAANAGSAPTDFALFLARNTTFDTPSIDLQPFQPTSQSEFDFGFVSLQNLFVKQSVDIFSSESRLFFIAGNTIDFAPGTFLSTDAPHVTVITLGADLTGNLSTGVAFSAGGTELTLVDASIGNSRPGGSLSVFAPLIHLLRGGLASEGNLNVDSRGDLVVLDGIANLSNGGGTGKSLVQLFARHDLDVQADGNITLQQAAVYGVNTTMSAQKNFTATAVAFGVNFQGSNLLPDRAQTVSLQAGDLMSLTAVAFRAPDVSLQARTIALSNVDFAAGSTVSLRSQSGQLAPNPNTNQPVRLGDVNFIQNVRHGGFPAERAVSGGSITISK